MALILAIEPDRRQSTQLKAIVQNRLGADLVLADTTERAVEAIGSRIPDLVLVPALLSPQDDAALATALRVIAAAAHVQMLTIPLLAAPSKRSSPGEGVLSRLRRAKPRPAAPDGCDPSVFAEQIAEYLQRAAAERERIAASAIFDDEPAVAFAEPPAASEIVRQPAAEPIDEWAAAFEEKPALVTAIEPEPLEPLVDLFEAPEPQEHMAIVQPILADSAFESPLVPETLDDAVMQASLVEGQQNTSETSDLVDGGELDLGAFLAELEEKAEPITPVAAMMSVDQEPEPESIADGDDWAALPANLHRAWPRLDSFVTDAASERKRAAVREQAAATPVLRDQAAAPNVREHRAAPAVEPERARTSRPEWLDMLEALRRDIQRLRSERAGGAAPASAAPVRPAEQTERRPASVTPIKPPAESPAQGLPKKRRKKNQAAIQDEWGFFDPEQCGFAALVAKLDEIADTADEAPAGPPA